MQEMLQELLHRVEEWMRGILHWVEAFAGQPHATWALFAISFAESSFFPIPPDALLIPLCVAQPERAFWFAGVCSVASILGGMAGYGIGYAGGRPLLSRLFKPAKVAAVAAYYEKYNAWATGIAGLTPLPYKLFTISGGAFAINFRIFVLASVVSRSLRFFAVAGLIYWLGDPAKKFIEAHLGWLTISFVILLVLGFWLVGRKARGVARDAGDAEGDEAVGMSARRYLVFGRVQGVAFRAFTRRRALDLGATGWVRNREDGSVEAVAVGGEDVLAEFRRAIERGPAAARVDRIDETTTDESEATSASFEIRY